MIMMLRAGVVFIQILLSSYHNDMIYNSVDDIRAWHKMQRIRPSWTVLALSGFAHEHNKNQGWRRPKVKNIEHLEAYFLSRL